MHWIVQSNMYAADGLERIVDGLRQTGATFSLHTVVPFSHELQPEIEPSCPTVVLGTFTLCRIARERGWTPGAYLNENFNHAEVEKHWPTLNRDGRFYALSDVPEQVDPFFLRPLDDGKVFAGHVTDWPTFSEWRSRLLSLGHEGTVTRDTMVVVAKPKEIRTETRVWMVDQKAVAASIYKSGTLVRYEAGCDAGVRRFCEKLAERWSPERAYCIDVAVTEDGPSVVELTNLNSAGFYAADIAAVIRAIEAHGRR